MTNMAGCPEGPGAGATAPVRAGAQLVSMLLREEDMGMRIGFDLGPLFRATSGFDRVFGLPQHSLRSRVDEDYPP